MNPDFPRLALFLTRTSVSLLSSESCPGIQHRPFACKKRILQTSTVSFPQALLGAFVLLQHAGALQQALPQVLPHPAAGPPVLLLLLVVLGHGGANDPSPPATPPTSTATGPRRPPPSWRFPQRPPRRRGAALPEEAAGEVGTAEGPRRRSPLPAAA